MPDLVEGLLEVDEDDAELLVLVDGRLPGLEETDDLVVRRALLGEAALELADERLLPLVEPAKDDALAQFRRSGQQRDRSVTVDVDGRLPLLGNHDDYRLLPPGRDVAEAHGRIDEVDDRLQALSGEGF